MDDSAMLGPRDDSATLGRRRILVSTAMGIAGFAGCLDGLGTGDGAGPTGFDFGGVIIYSRPTAEEYQPLDVSVTIERDGEKRYDETYTVDDIVHGTAAIVSERWDEPRTPRTITVSSPEHEAQTLSTAEFDEEADRFDDELLYFTFELTGLGIIYRPVPVDEPLEEHP